MIGLLLTRWKVGLGIFGALAVFGLFAASWHYRHAYHDEKALRKADRAAYVAAQSEATLTAQRALEATEARYQEKANAADEKTALAVSAARAATADYAGRMRVKAPSCASSAAVAASQSDGARVPETVPADTFVAVSDADLQACGVNTATLLQAREWALSITE